MKRVRILRHLRKLMPSIDEVASPGSGLGLVDSVDAALDRLFSES